MKYPNSYMPSTKTILVTFLILTCIGVGATIIALSLKKKTHHAGTPTNWSSAQINTVYTLLMQQLSKNPEMKMIANPSIVHCMVNHVAQKYSYDDVVVNGKFNDDFNINDKNADKLFSGCLGSKGAWEPEFKKTIINSMAKSGLKPDCVTCLVNGMEKKFSPSEFDKMSDPSVIESIMKDCPECPKT